MPGCTVCQHADREEVDAALVGGLAQREAARRFGLSKDAVRRHADNHLSASLIRAQKKREDAGAATALERLEQLYDRASQLLDTAEEAGKAALALSAIRELRGIVETLARITGELDERPSVAVNLVQSEEWTAIQSVILTTLAAHPEARLDVVRALQGVQVVAGEVLP